MTLRRIEALLKEAMGLDAASIGASAVERVVAERQRTVGMGPGAYFEHVSSSPVELQALIEAVVVPETWFFRDAEAFDALGRVVRRLLADDQSASPVHLLSLPCATGEEPYSMAMALLDAGITPQRFRIDAVDISGPALARARRGVYGKGSFRGEQLAFRDRYFEAVESSHVINQPVRANVEFRQGNLFDPRLAASAERYDVVFCRNLLIYFDPSTQQRAIGVLTRLLAPNGVLFVGAAESPVLLGYGLVPLNERRSHAFRRRDPNSELGTRNSEVAHPNSERGTRNSELERRKPGDASESDRASTAFRVQRPELRRANSEFRALRSELRGATSEFRAPSSELGSPSSELRPLDEGVRLANEGRLVEAARCCEEHMRCNGPSPQAFYLLGLVRDSAGEYEDAAACYRKALYLDPNHEEALVHLALLMEALDNEVEAQLLRDRAQRVAEARG